MNYTPIINLPLENHEVPDLREQVGWGRRDQDYPPYSSVATSGRV